MLFVYSKPPPLRPTALLRELEELAPVLRDVEMRMARLFAQIDRAKAWNEAGCSSIGHLGERYAISADRARLLGGVGKLLLALPSTEGDVRSGRMSLEAASLIGPIVSNPALLRSTDDWVGSAKRESIGRLRHLVNVRIEELRSGDVPVVTLAIVVREPAREKFKRARQIASAKACHDLTEGQTFEVVVDHYLKSFDPRLVAPGERRVADTAMVNGRYVPMAVQREVDDRQGHRCAVPLCDNSMFLERAHIVAHASGGDREADNLLLLCSWHHFQLDSKWIRLEGTASKPVFFDLQGRDLSKRITRELDPPAQDPPAQDPPATDPPTSVSQISDDDPGPPRAGATGDPPSAGAASPNSESGHSGDDPPPPRLPPDRRTDHRSGRGTSRRSSSEAGEPPDS